MTHGVGDQALSVEAIREILGTGFPDRFTTEQGLMEWAEAVHNGQYLLSEVISSWNAGEVANPVEGYTGGSGAAPGSGHAATVTDWGDPGYFVPEDFSTAIKGTGEWVDRVTEWDLTEDERDLLMRHMYWRFTNGYGPDESNPTNWIPGGSIEDFMGGLESNTAENRSDWAIYDAVDDWFGSASMNEGAFDTYTPSSGMLPEGWLTFWGEDYKNTEGVTVIDNWLDKWVEIFNKNSAATGGPGDPKYADADLLHDFYNHSENGLYAQSWWNDKTNNFLSMTEMWYTQGGPGGVSGLDALMPGYEGADWTAYSGTGNWNKIWSDSIEIIRATAEDLGIEDDLTDTMVSQIAFTLMAEGGASAHLHPQTAEGWPNQARQLTENILINNIRSGTFEQPLGVGSIADIEKRLRAYADSQMTDIDALAAMSNTTVREWALNIKSETGLNETQVMSTIANQAYSEWGLTADEIDGMGQVGAEDSSTITNFIAPLWAGATDVWEDNSYRKDDEWLMDNYQIEEDGVKRFRTKQEMRALARTNMDRFQHSTQFQNPMNQFIQGAASMFRSDY